MASNMKDYAVLVTGVAGNLGRQLSQKLINEGAYVIGIDTPRAVSSLNKSLNAGQCRFLSGDLLDPDVIGKAVVELSKATHGPRAVYHLAAISDASVCEANPQLAYETNVLMVARLMEACRQSKIRRIIFPSTAYVYGIDRSQVLGEEDSVTAKGIYPLSKYLAEGIISCHQNSTEFRCDILRISNIYGPSSKPNTIYGSIMHQGQTTGEIVLKDFKPVRDYIYIKDVVEAMVRVLSAGDEDGIRVFNLSTGVGTSAAELAKLFCEVSGLSKDMIRESSNDTPSSHLVLSNEKLCSRLAWRPQYSLKEGIKDTLNILGELRHVKT